VTPPIKHYRAIWLSDIHLGTRGCKADFLLDFLRTHESAYLYLVGDIVDGWRLRKSWYWPQSHNDIVQKILRKSRKGTEVVYVPGNHDEALRDYVDMQFGGITISSEAIHITADNRRFLIIHGDEFDGVMQYAKWLAILGDWAYEIMLQVNHVYNWIRRKLGYSYWSLSAYLKHKVKNAVNFISDFEQTLANEARRRGFDGVICGHIHKAEIRRLGDILYCNDGDWVESCTALIEDWDGQFFIVHWTDKQHYFQFENPLDENSDRVRRLVATD
jgi:UDP-2,3-diacylglucosamine pyrophosphatase LpxH